MKAHLKALRAAVDAAKADMDAREATERTASAAAKAAKDAADKARIEHWDATRALEAATLKARTPTEAQARVLGEFARGYTVKAYRSGLYSSREWVTPSGETVSRYTMRAPPFTMLDLLVKMGRLEIKHEDGMRRLTYRLAQLAAEVKP